MNQDEALQALREIAGDDLAEEVLRFAAEAEGAAEELEELEVPEKSAKTFASQLERLAASVPSKRVANTLMKIAEQVRNSPKAKWPGIAAMIRRAVEKEDDKIRERAERIASKMEEEAIGEYGYAYPEPRKGGDLVAIIEEVARAVVSEELEKASATNELAKRLKAVEDQLAEIREGLEAVKARTAIPLPTTTEPVSIPPAVALLKTRM